LGSEESLAFKQVVKNTHEQHHAVSKRRRVTGTRKIEERLPEKVAGGYRFVSFGQTACRGYRRLPEMYQDIPECAAYRALTNWTTAKNVGFLLVLLSCV